MKVDNLTTVAEGSQSSLAPSLRLGWWPWLLVLALLVVNVIFWEIQPTVWLDEISYSDPAVNWVRGTGFVSSAWYAQGADAFWSGNVPLHQFFLAGWLKVFGISEWAVRIFGLMVGCAAMGIFLWAGTRLGWFVNRTWMITALLLLLLADGTSFTYRSGRSDALILLLAALQLLACTLPKAGGRKSLLFLTAFLAPWAGLQLVVYLALAWLAAIVVSRGRLFRKAAVVAVGVTAGLAALAAFYVYHGTLADFWHSIRRHTAAGETGVWPWSDWLHLPFTDRSAVFLLMGGLGLFAWGAVKGKRDVWAPSLGGVLALVLVPVVMKAAGTYKLYYAWMALVPAVFLLIRAVQSCESRMLRAWAGFAAIAAILIGLPLRLFLSGLADPLPLKKEAVMMIGRELRPDDKAISHSKFYYPVRMKAQQAYFPSYLQRITPEERAAVRIMILDPVDGPWPEGESRESWKEVARLSSPAHENLPLFLRNALKKYTAREINLPWDIVIYRRQGDR